MTDMLTPADRARVTAAVIAAEQRTDAEIVTIVAPASDAYHDVALHWAIFATFVVIGVAAIRPDWLETLRTVADSRWTTASTRTDLLTPLLLFAAITFLTVRLLASVTALRTRLTPGATKARRVRRRAVMLFRVGVQHHTADRNGVLLYLSLAERRAEIVADHAVHQAVAPEIWGDILSDLLVAVRAGQPGDGMVAAVAAIGATLATAFPPSGRDAAELPDRLIQL